MKTHLIVLTLSLSLLLSSYSEAQEFYEIKLYLIDSPEQEAQIDNYLKNAYIPALNKAGIENIGVFKPIKGDTIHYGKRIYVLTPFKSIQQFLEIPASLKNNNQYLKAAYDYLEAPHDKSPYNRIETTFLKAFKNMPLLKLPQLKGNPENHIYELRSYESATENLLEKKIHMFNEGGEIPLFDSLNFNAVFFAEVLIGSKTPNLMYMTSFDSMEVRDQYWKTFFSSEKWKELIANKYYDNSVSKAEIFLLNRTSYSGI